MIKVRSPYTPLFFAVTAFVAILFVATTAITAETNSTEATACSESHVTDIDGVTYETISLGGECWMAENLRVTHYRDGSPIAKIEDHWEWWDDTEGSYALYDHEFPFRYIAEEVASDEEMREKYGYLYNFYAVDNPSGLCPEGWRVPTDLDWQQLEVALGMTATEAQSRWYRKGNVGSRLAGHTERWGEDGIKTEHFGDSGFNVVPAGYRRSYGDYGNIGSNANFWTADEQDEKNAVSREIYSGNTGIYRVDNINKNNGHSVRCIQE